MSGARSIDAEIKALVRLAPGAVLRLAGVEVGAQPVALTDVQVGPAKHDADHVFCIGTDEDPRRWALYLEYQLLPKRRELARWFYKTAGLTVQLGRPVVLLVVYLTRGRHRAFPSAYAAEGGPLRNSFNFEAVRLWEHAERIRTGELAELAPLLLLCEDNPTLATVERERELILGLEGVSRQQQVDLLGVAVGVARRYFAEEVLRAVFREEEAMLLKETRWVQGWIKEAKEEAQAEGEAAGVRRSLLEVLRARFGPLPLSVIDRVNTADAAWCHSTITRAAVAEALADLGLE